MVSGLEAINLDIDRHDNLYKRLISPPGREPCEIDTYYLRKFLSHATLIKFLHLGNLHDRDGFFEWLGARAPSEAYDGPPEFEPPSSPIFSQLRELEIVSCSMSPQQLLTIVRKHSTTLRRLFIEDVSLFDIDIEAAARFIKGLAQVGKHLEDVHLSFFAAGDHDFPVAITGRYSRGGIFSYKGPNMKEELEDLTVIGPPPSDFQGNPNSNIFQRQVQMLTLRALTIEDDDLSDEDMYDDSEYDEYDDINGFDDFEEYLQEQEDGMGVINDIFNELESGLIVAGKYRYTYCNFYIHHKLSFESRSSSLLTPNATGFYDT